MFVAVEYQHIPMNGLKETRARFETSNPNDESMVLIYEDGKKFGYPMKKILELNKQDLIHLYGKTSREHAQTRLAASMIINKLEKLNMERPDKDPASNAIQVVEKDGVKATEEGVHFVDSSGQECFLNIVEDLPVICNDLIKMFLRQLEPSILVERKMREHLVRRLVENERRRRNLSSRKYTRGECEEIKENANGRIIITYPGEVLLNLVIFEAK